MKKIIGLGSLFYYLNSEGFYGFICSIFCFASRTGLGGPYDIMTIVAMWAGLNRETRLPILKTRISPSQTDQPAQYSQTSGQQGNLDLKLGRM